MVKSRLSKDYQKLSGHFMSVYDSKLSYIHQTAKEFLLHPERKGRWRGHLSGSESHSTRSQLCLHYLLLPDITISVKGEAAKDQLHPLLAYAAAHWPLHYISQEAAIADQSRKDTHTLGLAVMFKLDCEIRTDKVVLHKGAVLDLRVGSRVSSVQ